MATNAYFRQARTGGTVNALDGIAGSLLSGGEVAFVYEDGGPPGTLFFYVLDADSGEAESSPDVISPDVGAGDKRWILQRIYSQANITVSATAPASPVTNDLWVDIS